MIPGLLELVAMRVELSGEVEGKRCVGKVEWNQSLAHHVQTTIARGHSCKWIQLNNINKPPKLFYKTLMWLIIFSRSLQHLSPCKGPSPSLCSASCTCALPMLARVNPLLLVNPFVLYISILTCWITNSTNMLTLPISFIHKDPAFVNVL